MNISSHISCSCIQSYASRHQKFSDARLMRLEEYLGYAPWQLIYSLYPDQTLQEV